MTWTSIGSSRCCLRQGGPDSTPADTGDKPDPKREAPGEGIAGHGQLQPAGRHNMVRPAQDSNPAPRADVFDDDPAAIFHLQKHAAASAANDNAPARLEFTLLENAHGLLTKRID